MPAGIERNPIVASTEQIPHLEPLSEVNSLYRPSTELPPPPSLVAPQQVVHVPETSRRMRDAIPWKLSLVLENRGNVARDHLASERTYLAYVRTSLACASAGVALVQLFMLSGSTTTGVDLTNFAKPLGATVILIGVIILVVGVFRYFTTQSALISGHFPVARHSITMITFALGSLVGIVFGITVAKTAR